MKRAVTFLGILTKIITGLGSMRTCVPNTQFILNGRICHCNSDGWWTDADCLSLARRANCLAGQIVWHGCSQCICQENGQLVCSNAGCYEDATYRGVSIPPSLTSITKKDMPNFWCTPFKSYYINCSICVCPASGRTSEAHCANDNSCQRVPPSSSDFLLSVNKNICIPNVMYLFPCLHCLCSDGGYFVVDKCVETCHRSQLVTEPPRRCLSRTFYRKNCNVCWCPDNNIPDNRFCSRAHCDKKSKFQSLDNLSASSIKCNAYTFLQPKCYYCSCSTKGEINENSCLQLECFKFDGFKYDVSKTTCSPGEMVPICMECFCLRSGLTNKAYCSKACSYQNKLSVLETVLRENRTAKEILIDKKDLKRTSDDEQCNPNSMYVDQGRYCLCPENGNTNFKLCTSVFEEAVTRKPTTNISSSSMKNLNQTCTPNTFVEIDCNTCYCGKNGTIDPKWCTYDDCSAKRIIESTHKGNMAATMPIFNSTCVAGSVSKTECNFCICPENGKLKDQACTKNKCSDISVKVDEDKLVCEPLHYYLVDCNVCLCPRDGIKNVGKCTKKICEKHFLRTETCIPGAFFSIDCNVCVCPPNGKKADTVCTKHKCADSETPWKRIFRLSLNLVDNTNKRGRGRELDVCFSGEEFEIGCKICTCTDVGLRNYATCIDSACEEENKVNSSLAVAADPLYDLVDGVELDRSRREGDSCMPFKLTNSAERKECTAGSMYIIRCRQCICPYVGNINLFCRPLPAGTYCEQAYPNFNFKPMSRRDRRVNGTATNTTQQYRPMNHNHTRYTCTKPGRVLDSCFICECEESSPLPTHDDDNAPLPPPSLAIIEEHCFKSDATKCKNKLRASFLNVENKTIDI